MARETDQERVIRALRKVLDAPGTSARHLAAKASAAHQLPRLQGLVAGAADGGVVAEADPDPMADLAQMEILRQRRARK
jgi:hypothetical protein